MVLYVIINRINGKRYVGISTDVNQRQREHFSGHGSKLVWSAIQKYGRQNLSLQVLFEGDESWIKQMEQYSIAQFNTIAPNGYNLTGGGEGSLGWKPTEITRRKMREAHLGRIYQPHSSETKRRISEAAKGRLLPDTHIFKKGFHGEAHGRATPIEIDGCKYGCLKDAALALGIRPATLRVQISRFNRTGQWPPGWRISVPCELAQE